MTSWQSDIGRRGWRGAAAVVGATSLVLLAVPLPPAAADSSLTSFTGLASAYGADFTLTNASIPLLPAVQGAGPTAQASLDSLDNSVAFASFPYPGEGAAGIGAFLSGIFGLPLPSYPLYVSTTTAPSSQDGGSPGITLHADSQANQAQSLATVGSGSPGAVSRAQVVNSSASGQGLTARATATFTGLGVGGVFTLAGGLSSAKATYSGDGSIKVESDLRFADLAVPGLRIQLPASTPTSMPIPVPIPGAPQLPPLNLPGVPIPAPFGGALIATPHLGFENGYFTVELPFLGPQKFLVPASSVLPALAAFGITMTYQAATPIVQNGKTVGVLAPGAVISTTVPAPPQNQAYNGPTHVKMTIGRSVASLSDIAGGSAVDDGSGAGGTVTSDPVSGAPDLGGGSASGDSGSPSLTGSQTGQLPLGGDVTGPALAGDGGAPQVAGQAGPAFATRAALGRDAMNIYLALVAVAAIGTLAAGAVRLQGVRLAWTS